MNSVGNPIAPVVKDVPLTIVSDFFCAYQPQVIGLRQATLHHTTDSESLSCNKIAVIFESRICQSVIPGF